MADSSREQLMWRSEILEDIVSSSVFIRWRQVMGIENISNNNRHGLHSGSLTINQ